MEAHLHTLASIADLVGDAAFIHDTLFMPDGGTARADFPGGSASALWSSIQRIMALPNDSRLLRATTIVPADARSPFGKAPSNQQRVENTHLTKAKTEEEFVALRKVPDRELPSPN